MNEDGKIVWQYGQAGVTGSEAKEHAAVAAALRDRHVLVADQGNQRIIEVNRAKKIVWRYGTTGVSGAGPEQLNSPNSAKLLRNGRVLIADEANNRVIEVTRDGHVAWQYGDPGTPASSTELRSRAGCPMATR